MTDVSGHPEPARCYRPICLGTDRRSAAALFRAAPPRPDRPAFRITNIRGRMRTGHRQRVAVGGQTPLPLSRIIASGPACGGRFPSAQRRSKTGRRLRLPPQPRRTTQRCRSRDRCGSPVRGYIASFIARAAVFCILTLTGPAPLLSSCRVVRGVRSCFRSSLRSAGGCP